MVVNRPPPVPRNVSSVNTLHGQLTLSPAFHRSGQGRGAGEEEKRKKVEEREEGWVPLPGRVGVVAGSGPRYLVPVGGLVMGPRRGDRIHVSPVPRDKAKTEEGSPVPDFVISCC